MKQASGKIGLDFTEGSILKKLIIFALPILASNLLQQLYNAVDTMVIGRFVGSVGTVGVSNGGEIANLLTYVATAFSSAGQIYIAQLVGARDRQRANEAIGTLIALCLWISLGFAVLCIALSAPILRMINTPVEALREAENYMIIVSLGLPAIFGYNAVCGLLRGMGETKRPLLFILIASITNIVLDILLVAVIPLAAAGTAIATIAAQYASFAASLLFLYRNREHFEFAFRASSFRMKKEHVKVLLGLGIPLSAQQVFIHITQVYCISRINAYGLVTSATNSIGNKIYRLITVFVQSMGGALGAMVGQNLGAGKPDRVKKIVRCGLALCLGFAVAESVVSWLFPRPIFRLFTVDEEVIEMGVTYLHLTTIVYFLSALQGPYCSVVTGSGNARLNLLGGILDGVVLRLGISLTLAHFIGVRGFWIGNYLAHLGMIGVAAVYYYSNRWQTYKLVKKAEPSK